MVAKDQSIWQPALRQNFYRQHLIGRSQDPIVIAGDLIGIHSARQKSAAMSLAARVDISRLGKPCDMIGPGKPLTRVPSMRSTLHILPQELARTVQLATRDFRIKRTTNSALRRGCNHVEIERAVRFTVEAVEANQVGQNELTDMVTAALIKINDMLSDPRKVASRIVRLAWDIGVISALDMSECWGKEERCFKKSVASTIDHPDDGCAKLHKQKLIESYVLSYGPVSLIDIIWWTGLRRVDVAHAINASEQLRQLPKSGCHPNLFLHIGSTEMTAFECPKFTFLGYEDNLMKGYYETRSRFGSSATLNKVFHSTGEAQATVLHHGTICGIWSWKPNGNATTIELFDTLSASQREDCIELFSNHIDQLNKLSCSPISTIHVENANNSILS